MSAPKPLIADNQHAGFLIADDLVNGRIITLGSQLDKALGGARYPDAVAGVLGEAVLIASLVAASLKFDGKLMVQAHGTNEGAISMAVAESTTGGHVRAYARFDAPSLERILAKTPRPNARQLMGGGTFAMTIDPAGSMERYQGLAAIDGDSLGDCAEHYFAQSEQVPTRISTAVGQTQEPGKDPVWRGGALMVQRMAGDAAREDTTDAWDMSKAVMGTLTSEELLDPNLPADQLLYRLFHEQGVRLLEPKNVTAQCSCSKKRLLATIKSFEPSAQQEMMQDGKITANCEFCGTDYVFTQADL